MVVPYLTFNKHAGVIVKKMGNSRPILCGVHHAENGDLYVTDSHRLYVAKNAQERKDGATINPITGEVIDGQYPDVSRVIPERFKAEYMIERPKITLEALQIAGLYDIAYEKRKKYDTLVAICVEKDNETERITYRTVNGFCKAEFTEAFGASYVDLTDTQRTIYVNLQYIIEALAFIIDVYGDKPVNVGLTGHMSPLLMWIGDVQALILPVRRN
ncbi:hypothetical protein [Aneurinibacillus aneurinilyticus]|uniref:hypothetical protein n=1 Tax=Aneurinibacillus aneurinilyticus TaxID=1391 RepID=UPI0023F23E05|nr:hypothetical protein [Aneurinibacillus aneurinilyticus]